MKKDYLILIPIIILFIISFIYLPNSLKYKELLWQILSIILCLIISKLRFNKILKYSLLFYIICIILLTLVLIINKYTNGSRAWLDLNIISIQPSELTKISLIILTYKYLDKLNIYILSLIYFIPMLLIFLEPDTGGVILILIIYLYFLFKIINKKQLTKLIIIITLFISILLLTYIYNKDFLIKLIGPSIFYRIERINSFINDNNLQTTNALISIATSNTLYFPEMYNDFYISYILSKNIYLLPFILTNTIIILLYLNKNNSIISNCTFYLILFQCYYNLLMNFKIVPVIGIPYLFISYGGSHIITTLMLLGLILNKKERLTNLS